MLGLQIATVILGLAPAGFAQGEKVVFSRSFKTGERLEVTVASRSETVHRHLKIVDPKPGEPTELDEDAEQRTDTYSFLLTRPGSSSPELILRRGARYMTSGGSADVERSLGIFRVLDAHLLEDGQVLLLYQAGYAVDTCRVHRREDGTWEEAEETFVYPSTENHPVFRAIFLSARPLRVYLEVQTYTATAVLLKPHGKRWKRVSIVPLPPKGRNLM